MIILNFIILFLFIYNIIEIGKNRKILNNFSFIMLEIRLDMTINS